MPFETASSVRLDAGMMQGSAAPPVTTPGQRGGKPLPAEGKGSPEAVSRPPSRPDLSRAIESLERFVRENARSLMFNYDESSGRTIITVMDAATGEVIRQIPPDEVLQLARSAAAAASGPLLITTRA
jgi:flagellar protein FlaG